MKQKREAQATVYLTPEQRERIDQIAHRDETTRSVILRRAVRQYLAQQPKKNEDIPE